MKPERPKENRGGTDRARVRRDAPRARLIGGDKLQGGPHVGPGHAGRHALWRGVLAIATAAILVVEQLLGGGLAMCGAGVALAQSPASGNSNIAFLHNPNGSRYISDVVGVTRQQVVDELSAHESDTYYLGTPYKGVNDTGNKPRPNGDPGGYSPGMQCIRPGQGGRNAIPNLCEHRRAPRQLGVSAQLVRRLRAQ